MEMEVQRFREETIHILKQFDTGNKFSSLPVPTGSSSVPTGSSSVPTGSSPGPTGSSSVPTGSSPVPTGAGRASVLIPLLVKNGELYTLMTLRSTQLRTGAGEVCFPGGKRDPSDGDDVDTALREAEEEIGLPAGDVQVVCRLVPIVSKSGLLVTPVVGFIDESFCPRPNPAEVSDVFTVPLDFFTSDKEHHAIHGAAGTAGRLHSFHFLDPDSGSRYHIFGLTAMFAIVVAALALRKKPQFDVVFDPEDPLLFFQQVLHRRASKL